MERVHSFSLYEIPSSRDVGSGCDAGILTWIAFRPDGQPQTPVTNRKLIEYEFLRHYDRAVDFRS